MQSRILNTDNYIIKSINSEKNTEAAYSWSCYSSPGFLSMSSTSWGAPSFTHIIQLRAHVPLYPVGAPHSRPPTQQALTTLLVASLSS